MVKVGLRLREIYEPPGDPLRRETWHEVVVRENGRPVIEIGELFHKRGSAWRAWTGGGRWVGEFRTRAEAVEAVVASASDFIARAQVEGVL